MDLDFVDRERMITGVQKMQQAEVINEGEEECCQGYN